jgi:hypothetical protein
MKELTEEHFAILRRHMAEMARNSARRRSTNG